MPFQMRITTLCFMLAVSLTTGNSMPKGRQQSSSSRVGLNIRSVKTAEGTARAVTKVESGIQTDFPSEDVEYSNSFVDEPILSCEEIFTMTDHNEDGRVTEPEYRQAHPNMTDEEVSYVFQRYDPDCDGNIYMENLCSNIDVEVGVEIGLGVAGQLPEPIEVDCRTVAMQICDQESFLVVWEQVEENEAADITVCRALQAHISCVTRENTLCDLDDYVTDVTRTVASFIRSGICPTIHVIEDTETELRQVRSAKHGHRSRYSNFLRNTNIDPNTLLRSSHTCLRSKMQPCNSDFISSLRSGAVDPCATLIDYRRCTRKSTRKCQDKNNAMRIKDGIKSITRAHRRAKLCA